MPPVGRHRAIALGNSGPQGSTERPARAAAPAPARLAATRPGGRQDAGEPARDGGGDRAEVGPQAVVAGDRDHRPPRARAAASPNGSRSPCTTSVGTATASSSAQPARRRRRGARRGGWSGNARQTTPAAPVAAAVRQATRAPEDRPPTSSGPPPRRACAQVVDDGRPGGVEPRRGRRRAPAGDAVGLLDERDGHPGGLRGRRRGDQVAGGDAAAGAVAEHEQRPRRPRRRAGGRAPARTACRRRRRSRPASEVGVVEHQAVGVEDQVGAEVAGREADRRTHGIAAPERVALRARPHGQRRDGHPRGEHVVRAAPARRRAARDGARAGGS